MARITSILSADRPRLAKATVVVTPRSPARGDNAYGNVARRPWIGTSSLTTVVQVASSHLQANRNAAIAKRNVASDALKCSPRMPRTAGASAEVAAACNDLNLASRRMVRCAPQTAKTVAALLASCPDRKSRGRT